MNTALSSLLPQWRYHSVRFVSSVSAAKSAGREGSYDLIIINAPLPDDTGVQLAIDAGGAKGTVVLLLIQGELYEEVFEKAAPHGVFVLSKPISRPILAAALGWMESARARLRTLEQKTISIEGKMEEIRIVNRAKWLLISELKMDEPQAHRYIEKQSMDRCISRRDVAEEIIKTYT